VFTRENTHIKELLKSFQSNKIFPHKHSYDLYRDWLHAVWSFLNMLQEPDKFKELDRYTKEEGAEFGRLFSIYTAAVEELPFQDILGDLFMELDVKSVRAGQFFTPWHVAEMMALMNFDRDSFEDTVDDKGVIDVCDPCVGSGVMLLAFAKVVDDDLGRWGLHKLRLYGQDIDERCVLMCRIQLRMNGLDSFGRMAALLSGVDCSKPSRDKPRKKRPKPLPEPVVVQAKPKNKEEVQATLKQMELF